MMPSRKCGLTGRPQGRLRAPRAGNAAGAPVGLDLRPQSPAEGGRRLLSVCPLHSAHSLHSFFLEFQAHGPNGTPLKPSPTDIQARPVKPAQSQMFQERAHMNMAIPLCLHQQLILLQGPTPQPTSISKLPVNPTPARTLQAGMASQSPTCITVQVFQPSQVNLEFV